MYFANIYSGDWVERKKQVICRLSENQAYMLTDCESNSFRPVFMFLMRQQPQVAIAIIMSAREAVTEMSLYSGLCHFGSRLQSAYSDKDVLTIQTVMNATFWVCGHIST